MHYNIINNKWFLTKIGYQALKTTKYILWLANSYQDNCIKKEPKGSKDQADSVQLKCHTPPRSMSTNFTSPSSSIFGQMNTYLVNLGYAIVNHWHTDASYILFGEYDIISNISVEILVKFHFIYVLKLKFHLLHFIPGFRNLCQVRMMIESLRCWSYVQAKLRVSFNYISTRIVVSRTFIRISKSPFYYLW